MIIFFFRKRRADEDVKPQDAADGSLTLTDSASGAMVEAQSRHSDWKHYKLRFIKCL